MYTHHPYGVQWTDLDDPTGVINPHPGGVRDFPGVSDNWENGREYLELMKQGEVDWLSDYERAVERTVDHVDDIRDTLQDMDVYDDTTVTVQADHGEAFGGVGYDDCNHLIHTHQSCNHITDTTTTVLDRDIDIDEPLLQKDTLALWDERWRGGRDDLEPIERDNPGGVGTGEAEERLKDLGYL